MIMFAPITPMFALLALFAAATLATPAPRVHSFARDIPESIANATALGINVYGHIPDDAVKIGESSYSAEVGTLAHAWIRAQIDIDWTSETARDAAKMVKRELAHIGIGMWTQDWCKFCSLSCPATERPHMGVAKQVPFAVENFMQKR